MATRALIGYLDTNGDLKLTSTYNHYDGYPWNLGDALETFYNNDSKAEEIANIGYISYLDPETGITDILHTYQLIGRTSPDDTPEALLYTGGKP